MHEGVPDTKHEQVLAQCLPLAQENQNWSSWATPMILFGFADASSGFSLWQRAITVSAAFQASSLLSNAARVKPCVSRTCILWQKCMQVPAQAVHPAQHLSLWFKSTSLSDTHLPWRPLCMIMSHRKTNMPTNEVPWSKLNALSWCYRFLMASKCLELHGHTTIELQTMQPEIHMGPCHVTWDHDLLCGCLLFILLLPCFDPLEAFAVFQYFFRKLNLLFLVCQALENAQGSICILLQLLVSFQLPTGQPLQVGARIIHDSVVCRSLLSCQLLLYVGWGSSCRLGSCCHLGASVRHSWHQDCTHRATAPLLRHVPAAPFGHPGQDVDREGHYGAHKWRHEYPLCGHFFFSFSLFFSIFFPFFFIFCFT